MSYIKPDKKNWWSDVSLLLLMGVLVGLAVYVVPDALRTIFAAFVEKALC
ncbi:hypothetical protein LCGC14_2538660 [marine sediment metagenome]|uniref:Uncharacterized protein n=1 Tax=marine sediment metagenome TaxID=412755 RepID=A0A0F9BE69_9ZZZZ